MAGSDRTRRRANSWTLKRDVPATGGPPVARRWPLLLSVLVATVSAASQPPIALVTDLRGDVRLRRAGESESKPLSRTDFLRAGDLLQTGADGHATLFQLYAPVAALLPDRSYALQPLPPRLSPEVLPPDLFALLARHVAAAARSAPAPSSPVRRGASELVITALAPRQNLVLDPRPAFEWTRVPDAPSYELTLYDPTERVLWRTTTRQTRVSYPTDRAPLAPGRYTWEVIAESGRRSGLDTAPFTVAAPEAAAAVRRMLGRAARLVAGANISPLPSLAVCIEHRLYPQAEAILKQAAARTPGDPVLAELAMRVYQLTGRSEERERTRPIRIGAEKETR